ncbi:Na+/H+ antiporter subunit B [Desulfoferrobacter suflitae]|uniref:Na+/H+ antiporter subunit B n=1 Tax=Desulfoferrobacter suflitae TaxID=2865782 RepID=UPI0021641357|nr:Na+/H+ antiporter subunit B [Desulfoferrobacter suflitae]MCK8600374.1 Na+/H+ antiporter subunit B [Desulfoferrobacter suflitae]
MSSLILSAATRYLLPLLLLLSVYLLLRGHNLPGGGFVGGLVGAAAFALHCIAHGVETSKRVLRVQPRTLIAVGLLTAALSGSLSLFAGRPFMTGIWNSDGLTILGKIGTPAVFDMGVYLVVLGVVLTIIYSLSEE